MKIIHTAPIYLRVIRTTTKFGYQILLLAKKIYPNFKKRNTDAPITEQPPSRNLALHFRYIYARPSSWQNIFCINCREQLECFRGRSTGQKRYERHTELFLQEFMLLILHRILSGACGESWSRGRSGRTWKAGRRWEQRGCVPLISLVFLVLVQS